MNLTLEQWEMLRALGRGDSLAAREARFGRFEACELACQLISLRLAEPTGRGTVELSILGRAALRDVSRRAAALGGAS